MAKVSRAPFLEAKPIMELASKFEMELDLKNTNELEGATVGCAH